MTKIEHKELTLKQKRIMTYFIEATEKLILEDGIDGLSIRKIASEAGYNSATIYNYFESLEMLVLFASVGYLRDYVSDIRSEIKDGMSSLEIYRTVYRVFNKHSFGSPEIFYNMFFGKHSNQLTKIIKQYYEVFPDELEGQTTSIKTMLTQGDIYQRDKPIMEMLVRDGIVNEDKSEMVIELIVRTQHSYLLEASGLRDESKINDHIEEFLRLFDYILSQAK